ncbi:interferon-induced transmembrane protein 1-like [Tautogolabrus adspersus]
MERGQVRVLAPSYMAWSIFNTFCCCLPLGIAAIIYSNKAQTANTLGQTSEAMDASRTAKVLNILALVFGIILLIIFITLKVNNPNEH